MLFGDCVVVVAAIILVASRFWVAAVVDFASLLLFWWLLFRSLLLISAFDGIFFCFHGSSGILDDESIKLGVGKPRWSTCPVSYKIAHLDWGLPPLSVQPTVPHCLLSSRNPWVPQRTEQEQQLPWFEICSISSRLTGSMIQVQTRADHRASSPKANEDIAGVVVGPWACQLPPSAELDHARFGEVPHQRSHSFRWENSNIGCSRCSRSRTDPSHGCTG